MATRTSKMKKQKQKQAKAKQKKKNKNLEGKVEEEEALPKKGIQKDEKDRRSEGFKAIYNTWAIARTKKRSIFVMTSIRELIIYLLFLFLFFYVGVGSLHFYRHHHCRSLLTALTRQPFSESTFRHSFHSIKSKVDLYKYMQNIFHKALTTEDTNQNHRSLLNSMVVGALRVRQLRVKDYCEIPDYDFWFERCYGPYSSKFEYKGYYGGQEGSEWKWREAEGRTQYTGEVTCYPNHGFYLDVAKKVDINATAKNWEELNWIDDATRVVFIEFVTYTPINNFFSVIKLVQ